MARTKRPSPTALINSISTLTLSSPPPPLLQKQAGGRTSLPKVKVHKRRRAVQWRRNERVREWRRGCWEPNSRPAGLAGVEAVDDDDGDDDGNDVDRCRCRDRRRRRSKNADGNDGDDHAKGSMWRNTTHPHTQSQGEHHPQKDLFLFRESEEDEGGTRTETEHGTKSGIEWQEERFTLGIPSHFTRHRSRSLDMWYRKGAEVEGSMTRGLRSGGGGGGGGGLVWWDGGEKEGEGVGVVEEWMGEMDGAT